MCLLWDGEIRNSCFAPETSRSKCEASGSECEASGLKCEASGLKCEASGLECEASGLECETSGLAFHRTVVVHTAFKGFATCNAEGVIKHLLQS